MGTNLKKMKEITKKQSELKSWIEQLGWSQKEFARRYYFENNDTDIDIEIKRFEDKFKKQISRATTQVGLIDMYLNFLFSLNEFKKNNFVKPQNHSKHEFSNEFNNKMKKISKMISQKL